MYNPALNLLKPYLLMFVLTLLPTKKYYVRDSCITKIHWCYTVGVDKFSTDVIQVKGYLNSCDFMEHIDYIV